MLTYSFADIGSDSLYSHLYECIKKDIETGVLTAGAKLPSKRSLAKNLGISVITVENAYGQLCAEGYVRSVPKSGYFVSTLRNIISAQMPAQELRSISDGMDYQKFTADFSSNAPIRDIFPFSVWAKILRDCLHETPETMLSSSPGNGIEELRSAIAEHLRSFRGMMVSPAQIIVGSGSEHLYSLLVQFLGRDKIYGLENPGNIKTEQVCKANGAKIKWIKFDKDGIDISELNGVAVAVTSPSHQFPTGIVTPISKRYELLGWAAKAEDRFIIEDDFDSEFRLSGKPIPALQSIDNSEKVIYMNTFSKSLTPALRISYMVLPPHLAQKYQKNFCFYSCPVPRLIQSALARFIKQGFFEKHINRARTFYKKQRNALMHLVQQSKMAGFACISEEDSGLHFILKIDIPCSDEDFSRKLEEKNVRLHALSQYYRGEDQLGIRGFIMNYSSLSEKQMETAINIISEEASKLRS